MGLSTRVRKLDPNAVDPAAIDDAAQVIRAGGLVAFPTETVYGLGADATNAEAVAKIFEAKGRPPNNPLIIHGHDVDQVRTAVAEWPHTAEQLANAFWPGPLTLVLPRSRAIPDVVSARLDSVGVRVPDHPVALALLMTAGRLLAAPSANRSTGVSPTTAAHVSKDLEGRIDLILDAGPTVIGLESTVLDLISTVPRVLRPGAITASQLSRVLGTEIVFGGQTTTAPESALRSPGQMEIHYAPRALLVIKESNDIASGSGSPPGRAGLIVAGQSLTVASNAYTERIEWLDPLEAGRELYGTLHRWDDASFERIDVVLPDAEDDAWRAVRDRLWRASRPWSRGGHVAP